MKLLDRLIIIEFLGPFSFGVILFTSLLTAVVYLFGLTDYFVNGVPLPLILKLMLLYLPGLIVWTFPMATLLAALLALGRLSSDSELIAAFASGVSVPRIIAPVAAMGLLISGVAFLFGEFIVPATALQAAYLKNEVVSKLTKTKEPRLVSSYENKKLKETFVFQGADAKLKILYNVIYTRYDLKTGEVALMVHSPRVENVNGSWRFEKPVPVVKPFDPQKSFTASIENAQGIDQSRIEMNKTPEQLAIDSIPTENLSTQQMLDRIAERKMRGQSANGVWIDYYNKFSLPLSSVVFSLLAAPLGIRDPRRGGAALGWMSAIGIIISYWVLMRFVGVLGSEGAVAAWFASFLPNILGLILAACLMWKRSR